MRRLLHVSALIGLMLLLALSFFALQACEDEDEPEADTQNTCPTNGGDDDDVADDDDDDDDDDDTTDDDTDDDDDDDTFPGDEVDVDSTSATWIDSGLTVAVDDEIDFAATGTIAIGNDYTEVTPDGVDGTTCGDECPLADAPRGALIGRIGEAKGDPFLIGSELADYTATEAGSIYLIVNDNNYTNNSGTFKVYIDGATSGDDDTTDDDTTDDDTADDDTTDDDTADDDVA